MPPDTKVYLGDGVYAEWDGMGVWLTTERAAGEHRIYLEPPMVKSLTEWLAVQRSPRRQLKCDNCLHPATEHVDGTGPCAVELPAESPMTGAPSTVWCACGAFE